MKAVFLVPQIGFNEKELFTIKAFFEKNSIDCIIASYSKGKVIGKEGTAISASELLADISPDDYGCAIIVGGGNISSLLTYKYVIDFLESMHKKNKILALLCMAPAILSDHVSFLKNRKITVFHSKNGWSIENIRKNGSILIDEPVVIDGNIFTCRDEWDAELLAQMLVDLLNK